MEDIFTVDKTPTSDETFFHISYSSKTEEEMMEVINMLDPVTDINMLHVIFKKCKYHRPRIAAGKLLYYTRY